MTDFSELLRKHGAPLPHAVTMETEVRSEGALTFQKLTVPGWATDVKSSSMIAEWRCDLDGAGVRDLQAFLKTVLPSGKTAQQAINEALLAQDIGYYLGTFIEEGMLVAGAATVRMLFAYRPANLRSIGDINTAIHQLLTAAPPASQDGATALGTLRDKWMAGTAKTEGGLMMLSEINLFDASQFPYTRAQVI